MVTTVDAVISFVGSADFFRPLFKESSGLVIGALADCSAVFVEAGAAIEDRACVVDGALADCSAIDGASTDRSAVFRVVEAGGDTND